MRAAKMSQRALKTIYPLETQFLQSKQVKVVKENPITRVGEKEAI